jgi:hypothetical protein
MKAYIFSFSASKDIRTGMYLCFTHEYTGRWVETRSEWNDTCKELNLKMFGLGWLAVPYTVASDLPPFCGTLIFRLGEVYGKLMPGNIYGWFYSSLTNYSSWPKAEFTIDDKGND